MSDSTPNFHVSYEKLKKIAEELRGGGDKDADYWAWRNDGSDESSSGDDFKKWISQKRNNTRSDDRNSRDRPSSGKEDRLKERGSYRRKTREEQHDLPGKPRDKTRNRGPQRDGSRDRSRDGSRDRSPEERAVKQEGPKHPAKRKQSDKRKKLELYDDDQQSQYNPVLWEPGDWERGPARCYYNSTASRTAKGGGVIKLPVKVTSPNMERHSPVGVVRNTPRKENGLNDFIYSDSGSDSDGNFNEEYSSAAAISNQLNDSAVLNVVGIERRIEKCSSEAGPGTTIFCKESCQKFLAEGMRKRNSLDVLCEAFEEHHTEIIHLRQELACMVCCAFMYDMNVCQDQQAEAVLWKNVFYLLIQYYRTSIANANSDNLKATLSQQLEEHIGEGISFYNMLVRQIQKRYQVNYKHHTTGHNRNQVLALLLLHKVFLWIGDLYRYLSQCRDSDEWGQARNCYLLAQTLAPRNPRPYHQLALLGKLAHRRLHAVYYFTLSLLVRNPFSQSKELLHGVLAELRRKAQLLAKRDEDRNKRSQIPGSKEVYSNKVIEWIFENSGDQSLSIPLPDLRKRLVVYLLSSVGGLISNIDLDRVDPEFQHFLKFYTHYIKLTSFKLDEVYLQLFVVQLYTLHHTSHSTQCSKILESFLTPALDTVLITGASQEEDGWLCKTHSPLSLIFLLAQYQIGCPTGEGMEKFTLEFKKKLIAWLNALQNAIQKYRKYTDFTEESVVLKEVTMLRGVEVLSSLQNITKPFYLKNLARDQSEDLGRAVLIVSTFEKLTETLSFLEYTDSKEFAYTTKTIEKQTSAKEGGTKDESVENDVKDVYVDANDVDANDVDANDVEDVDDQEDIGEAADEGESEEVVIEMDDRVSSLSEDSGSDIEIISQMKISEPNKEELVEDKRVDDQMTELKEKKEKLLQTLQQNENKREEVESAVKMIQGMRIMITVKPKYIIPDTNCFLDNVDKLQRIVMSCYKVLIPFIVLDEIHGLCKSEQKGARAALALDVVNNMIGDKSVALITSKGSIMESREFNEERCSISNDDMILNSVQSLSDKTGMSDEKKGMLHVTRFVVLLTDDSNLRLKAHNYNLAVQTIADFVLCAKL